MFNITARALTLGLLMVASSIDAQATGPVTSYVRFVADGSTSYGILAGDSVRVLAGDLFATPTPAPTGKVVKLSAVKLLAPCVPKKVIAVGLNYQTHLGTQAPATQPGLFAKMTTSIIAHEENIIYPGDAKNLHYEGEVVIVIGKVAKNVSVETAGDYIFGITAGNDVSERDWQAADLQWFRAKGSDTFGPLGPAIVKGLNYNNLLLQTRLNGQVVQSQRTSDLIFNIHTIVSYVSRYVTLEPGDVIYSGTPGTTRAMKVGDVVEVEVEGVGILRNRVARP
jgi:2-keto-4-pentenoate hydratase/2-oxohepta-3-ene-1,7-dioic acid hydratase in catechol pathway